MCSLPVRTKNGSTLPPRESTKHNTHKTRTRKLPDNNGSTTCINSEWYGIVDYCICPSVSKQWILKTCFLSWGKLDPLIESKWLFNTCFHMSNATFHGYNDQNSNAYRHLHNRKRLFYLLSQCLHSSRAILTASLSWSCQHHRFFGALA